MCIPKTASKRKLQVLRPRPKAAALRLWQERALASGLTLTHLPGPWLKRVPTPPVPWAGRKGGVLGKETQKVASMAFSLQLLTAKGT